LAVRPAGERHRACRAERGQSYMRMPDGEPTVMVTCLS